MKLPFFSTTTDVKELYWGLLLKEKSGICYLFQKARNNIHILKRLEFDYSDGWEHIVDDLDEAMSIIEKEYESGVNQCIFLIYSHLLDSNTKEIAKVYLLKMKEISNNLDLKPIGYMEIIDAIHEYMENKHDSVPLSRIIVEIDTTWLTIFIFKGGHKIQVNSISRTDELSVDVEVALEKNKSLMVLPNRMSIYNSKDLSDIASYLLSHSWSKNLFPQQPSIELIDPIKIDEAIRFLLEKQLCSVEAIEPVHHGKKEIMGFVIGEDFINHEKEETPSIDQKENRNIHSFFSHIRLPASILSSRRPSPTIYFIGGMIGIIVLCLFVLLSFFHKATVNIQYPTIKKTVSAEIVVSDAKSDNTIELEKQIQSRLFNETKNTTGKRDIGEKAQGEVTIYSYDDKERTITKGMKMQTGSLSFETEEQVKIPPSQFSSDGITKTPGKVKVKIHSVELGTEANIEKNKRFSFLDISANIVFGINESVFTGGTRKTVRVVSRQDMDDLRTLILQKAKRGESQTNVASKSAHIIQELTKRELKNEEFSAELGEQTDTLALKTNVLQTLYYLSDTVIQNSLKTVIEKQKPSGYLQQDSTIRVGKIKKNSNDENQISIQNELLYRKRINEHELKIKLRGKFISQVDQELIRLGLHSTNVTIYPPIPILSSVMPFWTNHIIIGATQ